MPGRNNGVIVIEDGSGTNIVARGLAGAGRYDEKQLSDSRVRIRVQYRWPIIGKRVLVAKRVCCWNCCWFAMVQHLESLGRQIPGAYRDCGKSPLAEPSRPRGHQRARDSRRSGWVDRWHRHRFRVCHPVRSPISLRCSYIRGADWMLARRRGLLILCKGHRCQPEKGRSKGQDTRLHSMLLECGIPVWIPSSKIPTSRQL